MHSRERHNAKDDNTTCVVRDSYTRNNIHTRALIYTHVQLVIATHPGRVAEPNNDGSSFGAYSETHTHTHPHYIHIRTQRQKCMYEQRMEEVYDTRHACARRIHTYVIYIFRGRRCLSDENNRNGPSRHVSGDVRDRRGHILRMGGRHISVLKKYIYIYMYLRREPIPFNFSLAYAESNRGLIAPRVIKQIWIFMQEKVQIRELYRVSKWLNFSVLYIIEEFEGFCARNCRWSVNIFFFFFILFKE